MRSLHDQIANKCKHFTGIQNDACAKGVVYKHVRDETIRPYRWPCFRDEGATTTCAGAEFPTEDKVKARIDEIEESGRKIGIARKVIVAETKGKRGVGGVIDCPACNAKASLHFSVERCNGHIHARCATAGCVSWME